MTTLREIEADLQALRDLLYEVGGDVTDEEADAAIDAWLEETTGAMHKKLDGYAGLIIATEGLANARKEEANRLLALSSADYAMVKRLKERLRWFLEGQKQQKIDTRFHRVTLADNGGVAPLEIASAADPETFKEGIYASMVKVTYSWDTAAIRKALAEGRALPFARLLERGKHVRVK